MREVIGRRLNRPSGECNQVLTVPSVHRVLGLLAATFSRFPEAAEHFEEALRFCRHADYRPELAWSCCDYADALLQRNGTGDREKAMSLLDESLAISTELGMRPLMERVDGLNQLLDSMPSKGLVYPDGLTPREVDVLKIVATGKTDREVAEELFISVGTVNTHVKSILNKTGSSNRTEATAYAVQRGLV